MCSSKEELGYVQEPSATGCDLPAAPQNGNRIPLSRSRSKRRAENRYNCAGRLALSVVHFSMACDDERRHRVAGQDFRRLLFSKQIQLLEALSHDWATRKASELQETLARHPFDDVKRS
jgi:Immunity protein 63